MKYYIKQNLFVLMHKYPPPPDAVVQACNHVVNIGGAGPAPPPPTLERKSEYWDVSPSNGTFLLTVYH